MLFDIAVVVMRYPPKWLLEQIGWACRTDGVGRAVTAHDGDRVIDAGLLGVVEVADVGFDALDQSADAGDFLVGGGGIGTGPSGRHRL